MEISSIVLGNIFVNRLKDQSKSIKAMASITYCGAVMKGFKVFENDRGRWIGMPSRKKNLKDPTDTEYEDTVFFPDPSIREFVERAILEQFDKE